MGHLPIGGKGGGGKRHKFAATKAKERDGGDGGDVDVQAPSDANEIYVESGDGMDGRKGDDAPGFTGNGDPGGDGGDGGKVNVFAGKSTYYKLWAGDGGDGGKGGKGTKDGAEGKGGNGGSVVVDVSAGSKDGGTLEGDGGAGAKTGKDGKVTTKAH